ncbi:carboxymuconolactone decarboxylase family protein [Ponticaulis profundi]|uniref:Carboxymuconolactone decarboxylase family protein n=1 Tax=Ponticaulis profundi TaxID=2665222 RepID=A0ABW1S988_9PROT
MSLFPSLPGRANLEDLFKAHAKGVEPLIALHDALLRSDDSELDIATRELITCYVSCLNRCAYCFGAHRTTAIAFGMDPQLIEALMADIETSPLPEKLKPLLHYTRKVTLKESVLPSDIRAIEDAGWQERTLHDVLMITCLYNFMNRLVDGAGLATKASYEAPRALAPEAKRQRSYREWGEEAGFLPS